MVTVNINQNLQVGEEDVLNGISKLTTSELENFLTKVAHLVTARKVSRFSEREIELLLIINNKYPEEIWSRYDILHKKLQAENINELESNELDALIEKIEKRSVIWLQALVELANLRKMTVDELMKELKINLRQRVENQG